MRILLLFFICVPFMVVAQENQTDGQVGNEFEGYSNINVTQGGSFEISNSPRNIAKLYSNFIKPYVTNKKGTKVNNNVFTSVVFEGTVTTTIQGNDFNTSVQVDVVNCPLPNLALRFRCYCIRNMMQDSANILKKRLDNAIDREEKLRKDNVKLIEKMKSLRNEIANCEITFKRNVISINEYENEIQPRFQAAIGEINRKMQALDDFIRDIPNH